MYLIAQTIAKPQPDRNKKHRPNLTQTMFFKL